MTRPECVRTITVRYTVVTQQIPIAHVARKPDDIDAWLDSLSEGDLREILDGVEPAKIVDATIEDIT